MKRIRTEDAVGHVLCHDMTQIIRGVVKDVVFRKGYVIQEEDIPVLLSIGKEHIYIWEKDEAMLHENDAAQALCELCQNEHMYPSEIKEGKIELLAACDGLFQVDTHRLNQVNALGEMMIACRHGNFPVHENDRLAGMRVIPLVIEKEKIRRAKELVGEKPLFALRPFLKKKAGIVATGSEVYTGRIRDTFTPVVLDKLEEYHADIVGCELCSDDSRMTAAAIRGLIGRGADLIICTGGMSVDPDDRTPAAIRSVADSVVTYGAPVLSGAMFHVA